MNAWTGTGTMECFQFTFMYIDRDTGEFGIREFAVSCKDHRENDTVVCVLSGVTRACDFEYTQQWL